MQSHSHFYVLVGGPGAGKTSVLKALFARHYHVVPEAARRVIAQQKRTGGDATPTGNKVAFCHALFSLLVDDYQYQQKHSLPNQPIFFDRGLPDAVYAANCILGGPTQEIDHAIQSFRYHSTVFLFAPWEEIYEADGVRSRFFTDAVQQYHELKKIYTQCGYQPLSVPQTTIENRVEFILKHI